MTNNTKVHTPVMVNEVIKFLRPSEDKTIVDMTMGAAGHTIELAELGANMICFERDEEIIEIAKQNIQKQNLQGKITIHKSEFSKAGKFITEKVDGVVFDLGVSSLQIDRPGRGFSFMSEGPLDMRMDKDLSVTAKDLINGLGKSELELLLTKYGEEAQSKKITKAILEKRKEKPFESTSELAELIEKTAGKKGKIHPATKVFQALRIAVNDELNELKAALPSALSLLKPKGVCVVISFHSLEDRIVKQIFNKQLESEFEILTPSPVTPSTEEIDKNARARSAKLRAIRRKE